MRVTEGFEVGEGGRGGIVRFYFKMIAPNVGEQIGVGPGWMQRDE